MVYKEIAKRWVHEIKPPTLECYYNLNKDFFPSYQVPTSFLHTTSSNCMKYGLIHKEYLTYGLLPKIFATTSCFRDFGIWNFITLTFSIPIWKKFQWWHLKLGPFPWPNPDFNGFTGQWVRKFDNLNIMIDRNLKSNPKPYNKIALSNQCNVLTLQSSNVVLYRKIRKNYTRTTNFIHQKSKYDGFLYTFLPLGL